MESFKHFLELSTIHGLSHISSTKEVGRIFWILVVICGFIGAGYIIYSSFDNWEKSPISTTIESLPISQVTFPNVTVCPPMESFLNLNHDIIKLDEINFEKSRLEVFDYAMNMIQNEYHNMIVTNMKKVQDPESYYNWYHGYEEIYFPYPNSFEIYTIAKTGNISTQYFGEKFNASKVESNIFISINVMIPDEVWGDHNTDLLFNIHKTTMKKVNGLDRMSFDNVFIDPEQSVFKKSILAPAPLFSPYSHGFKLERQVSKEEIDDMEMDLMPGFQLDWTFDTNLQDWPTLKYDIANMNLQTNVANFRRYIYIYVVKYLISISDLHNSFICSYNFYLYIRFVNVVQIMNDNAFVWKTVKKTRNSYISNYVGQPLNCHRTLISTNHIYYNTDKIINLLGLDSVSYGIMDNVTAETYQRAGEMFTYLNHCPPDLMIVTHRVFKNESIRDIVVAMTSILTKSPKSDKEISLKIWNKLTEKINMSSNHIDRITNRKNNPTDSDNFLHKCINGKIINSDVCSQFLHLIGTKLLNVFLVHLIFLFKTQPKMRE